MNREKVLSNMTWRFLERFGAQGVTFIVSIVLARLLDPDVYGTIALVTVFTSILQVFVDGGLGNALIQKKDADDLDFSTVFYANFTICICLYLLMFFCAPYIASFYGQQELTAVVRVLSLVLVVSGIKNIQQAYVSRNMLFKRFFYSTLGGTIGAAILGICLAYYGFGVWALVAQNLFNLFLDTLILWITVKWRPKKMFSFDRLKVLYSYGWKLLAASLIDNVYDNIRQLIIGKMYSSADLGLYNRGKQYPQFVINNVNTAIDSVLLSAMSREQEKIDAVKSMARRSIKVSSYIMAPLMIGLACTARPLVVLMLTEKWLPCVPYLQIFCISYMLQPMQTANVNAIKAMGKSDLFLKMDIMKRISGVLLLIMFMKFGVFALAVSFLISNIVCQIINAIPNKTLLNYSLFDQIKDLLPPIILASVMGVCISFVQLLNLSYLWTLIFQILLGIIIYFAGSFLFKMDSFVYLLDVVKEWKRKE